MPVPASTSTTAGLCITGGSVSTQVGLTVSVFSVCVCASATETFRGDSFSSGLRAVPRVAEYSVWVFRSAPGDGVDGDTLALGELTWGLRFLITGVTGGGVVMPKKLTSSGAINFFVFVPGPTFLAVVRLFSIAGATALGARVGLGGGGGGEAENTKCRVRYKSSP